MNREIWSFCLICLLICVFSRTSIIFVIYAKEVLIFTDMLKRLSRGYVSIFSPCCAFFSVFTIFYQISGRQNLLYLPDEGTSWVQKIPEKNGGRWDKCTERWEYLLRSFSKPQAVRLYNKTFLKATAKFDSREIFVVIMIEKNIAREILDKFQIAKVTSRGMPEKNSRREEIFEGNRFSRMGLIQGFCKNYFSQTQNLHRFRGN